MKEAVERYYDEVARQYKKGVLIELPWKPSGDYWRLYRDITWDSIKRCLPNNKDAHILDAGGGNGFWAIPIAKEGYNVTLIDISKEIIDVAKTNAREAGLNNIKFERVDIRNLQSFQNNTFDFVLAEADVVSYCLDAKKAVSEIARVAKVGTPVLVSVDGLFGQAHNYLMRGFLDKALELLKTRQGWYPIEKKEFRVRAFTVDELRNLFSENNLEVKRVIGKTVLFKPVNLSDTNKFLREEKTYKKILELELKYCENKELAENSSHIEIVGIKVGV